MKHTLRQNDLLSAFHAQVRLATPTPVEGYVHDRDGLVRREYGVDPARHATVETPEGLGPDPEAVIARQRDFFAGRGQELEWKTYDYDEPANLGELLVAAGFVAEDDEALILGEVAPLAAQEISLPEGVTVRAADGPEDFERIRELYRAVWGEDAAWVSGSLYERWRDNRDVVDVVVVEESRSGPVLCSARSEYDASPFVGLWGGSTLPGWRGRGLYRATLLHRARLAVGRGKTHVRVDASPDSEPILRRLGLERVATTTPYVLAPR